jgi:hypothetical protein
MTPGIPDPHQYNDSPWEESAFSLSGKIAIVKTHFSGPNAFFRSGCSANHHVPEIWDPRNELN